jgi:glycosyltransferase involved in cell wall biosynthesis
MRVVYITAGAAGMYCGSCLRDNTLVAALTRLGYDAMLVPTYTPITTDEEDVSQGRVFFGGVNVYLQQKSRLFRWTPWFLDRLLDARRLLRWVSRFAARTSAEELGPLTISMLEGEHGHQRKEVAKLVSWLADEAKPQIVNLTNALLSGIVPELRRRLNVPVLCTLQGDDIFTEALPEPYRTQALELIRRHCREMDGFITTSNYYTEFMTDYFAIPRDKITLIYPGLNLQGHGGARPARDGQPFTIGYFARICQEKGLHVLVDAFRLLKKMPGADNARLRVSGWLGKQHENYLHDLYKQLSRWGHADDVEHVDSPDHPGKVRFLQSIDVLSVPTIYREPKGLYVLEALANGVPVVQPRHGSFPELIEHTQGGLLVNPQDPEDLARALHRLATNPEEVHTLGERGKAVVHERFHAERMARETMALYERMVRGGTSPAA